MFSHVGINLLTWQEKELRIWFGTVDPATGLRRYRRIYDEKPKKNGKTQTLGGIPIYHLVAENHIYKPAAYGAASTKEQAGLVFKAALELIEANPLLKKKLRPYPSAKRIVQRDGPGFYQVLSSDGSGADGVEPSLILKDEYHRWSSARAETLDAILSKGTISREEPLEIKTTTAGSEDESLLWNEEREFAKAVIAGEIVAPSYYASIHQADERRVIEEPGYWESREARVSANPSHEDNGGFLRDAAIVEELAKAQKAGGNKNDYLRYHLGIKTSGTQENVIDIPQWITSNDASGVDLRQWPEYDAELIARKWGLIDKPCVLGVDASWSTDLSAVSAVFPPIEDDIWRILVWYWMPSAGIEKRRTTDQQPYDLWVKRGLITACPGNAIDYDSIKERIRWAMRMFDVHEVGYDPWNFRATAMDLLNDDNVPMVEVRQNMGQLSEPTKTLLGAYQDNRLWHGNNPVLLFNARSLALQGDRKDNVQPAKPERMKSKKRIDGIAATITAMNRGLHLVTQEKSPWGDPATAVM